ncbi:unnamed protein product [Heligmosomoides polygyrus]|uniref:BZIP domain-containing protein n=1 Tax=Heligmosomoides polygyrus TaxID=6339 RepID=A0A183FNB5_HELPZ|nr:unnamed protein product [Heligmosomoides polygyrus]
MRTFLLLLSCLVLYAASAAVNPEKGSQKGEKNEVQATSKTVEHFADAPVGEKGIANFALDGEKGKPSEQHREKRGARRRRLRRTRRRLARVKAQRDAARTQVRFYRNLETIRARAGTRASASGTPPQTV